MQEYLTKHNLKTKEQIAQHIVELKRNTIPDLGLISSLASYLFPAEKTDNLGSIPIDATNIEVFHLDTKDNGNRTAFIGFKISNGNFSFVEVPFTSQKLAEKETKTVTMPFGREFLTVVVEKENLDNQRDINSHVREAINSTRHKSRGGETHCGGYDKVKFPTKQKPRVYQEKEETNFLDKIGITVREESSELNEEQNKEYFNQLNNKKEAYKETEGKLFYELDWGFITQMAERMASNKKEDKYDLFNWKRPMTPKGIEDLKQATMRHLIAVMSGEYEDDEREFGHLEAISDNMMMLNYQLKLNKS